MSCGRPRDASNVSSRVSRTHHPPDGSGLPLSLVPPCLQCPGDSWQTSGCHASYHLSGPYLPHLVSRFTGEVEASASIPSMSQSRNCGVTTFCPFPPLVCQYLAAAVSLVSAQPALPVHAPAVTPSVFSVVSCAAGPAPRAAAPPPGVCCGVWVSPIPCPQSCVL